MPRTSALKCNFMDEEHVPSAAHKDCLGLKASNGDLNIPGRGHFKGTGSTDIGFYFRIYTFNQHFLLD
jgi:hypothetical protein